MRARSPGRQSGFTYLGLLAAVVILGLLLTVASRVWTFSERRAKEVQLLYVGDQFRKAIARYYAFGHHYPMALEELLTDNRFPVPRRHLRQLYRDPLTGDAAWTLVMDPTNIGIMGVASKSKLVPIKRKGFRDAEADFVDKDCYCDWKFVYTPPVRWNRGGSGPGVMPGPGSAPGIPTPGIGPGPGPGQGPAIGPGAIPGPGPAPGVPIPRIPTPGK